MAITPIGSLCTGNDKNSGTGTIGVSPARTVPVGRVLVAWLAWDSASSIFNPNDGQYTIWFEDTAENHWCTVAAGVNGGGAFFLAGVQVTIAVCQLRNQLTTGDTIYAHGFHVGTLACKAISIEEFDFGEGMRWCKDGAPWANKSDSGSGTPTSITRNTGVVQEWMFLHVLGTEGPDTDSFTWDADYTQIVGEGTTGGADDSNISLRGGYRIVSLQTDTVAVTNNTSSTRDTCQAMTAIFPVAPTPEFPTTPILDDFNRADEFPVDGGLWETADTAFGSACARIESNRGTGGGGSFFDRIEEDCVEVYATLAETGFAVWSNIFVHGSGNASLAEMKVAGTAAWAPGMFNNTGLDAILWGRTISGQGVFPDTYCLAWIPAVDGNKWGLQRTRYSSVHFLLHLWVDVGAGWEEVACMYEHENTVSDGAVGFSCLNNGSAIDDFGGGETPCFFRGIVSMNHRSATRHKAASRALVNPSDV